MQEKASGPGVREGLPEMEQIRKSCLVGVGKKEGENGACYGLNCVPPKKDVGVLTPQYLRA